MTEKTQKLKPCPFCNGMETGIRENSHWTGMRSVVTSVTIYHWCTPRDVFKLTRNTREEAIAAWNRRAPQCEKE